MAHPDEIDSKGRCIVCGDRLSAAITLGRTRFRRHLSKRDCCTRGRREIIEHRPSVQALRPLATQFNPAIVAAPPAVRPVSFERHPAKGSCMDASVLFATLPVRIGFPRLIRGAYLGALPSHAWLRFDHFDVDITAGQFADAPAPIIIADRSAWHRRSFVSVTPCPSGRRDHRGHSVRL